MQTRPSRTVPLRTVLTLGVAFGAALSSPAIIDRDLNLQSDIWQLAFDTGNLFAGADDDGDGFTNFDEALAGTDPFDSRSAPTLQLAAAAAGGGQLELRWASQWGKRYELEAASSLSGGGNWASAGVYEGDGLEQTAPFSSAGSTAGFFRVAIGDLDTDGDGLADWEERQIGFDPTRANTEGFGSTTVTDFTRINAALGLLNTVTVHAIDPAMVENWPDAGVVAVRRTGNLEPITVNFTLAGTATAGVDYTGPLTTSVVLGLGVDETWLEFVPRTDALAEPTETITVTVARGYNYAAGIVNSATLTLADAVADAVSEKEAARFLAQAGFGGNAADIAEVQALGIPGWIDAQRARPPQLHLPLVQQWQDERAAVGSSANSTHRSEVWWRRALQRDAQADPLRQRVAHALSQILVISDRLSSLDGTARGMAAYHDILVAHALGNYRDILRDVTLHPTMGLYLSHLRNRKADPSINRYPDENYAREVMQLFSIGLWELNSDGTRRLDGFGQPIPTYDNDTISSFARVFTGLSYGTRYTSYNNFIEIPTTGFLDGNGLNWYPMRGFDAQHDLEPKELLNGVTLPARTESSPDTGAATMADVEAAIDNLFNHPNAGPFVGRQLIQRLVTSNPSPAYIGRIATVFADNGAGVRGDLGAVVRAILLDPEARDGMALTNPVSGLQREPYLRYVALTRALGTDTADGRRYGFRNLDSEFLQRPYSSPSVFNFYSPGYRPLGPMQAVGLVGPEFQITNALTGITSPNRFYSVATSSTFRLNTSGETELALNTMIDPAPWLDDATNDPDGMLARLDRLLAAGELTPRTLRAIGRAVRRLPDPLATSDPDVRTTRATDRFRLALYLVTVSPDFSVLK